MTTSDHLGQSEVEDPGPKASRYELLFTADHLWLAREGDTIIIGITDQIANRHDIQDIHLPTDEEEMEEGQPLFSLMLDDRWVDFHCPLTGPVVDINAELEDDLEMLWEDPYGEGWVVQILSDDELYGFLDAAEYREQLE